MKKVTVLGASGFVGSRMMQRLAAEDVEVDAPARGESLTGKDLGTVIYCIGLTADFRKRPFDTVEAHVCLLKTVLERSEFESLVYLSATRVYLGASDAREGAELSVNPNRGEDLYNLTKLTGESLCLSCGRPDVRVARLSNVVGNDTRSENFITSVIRDAVVDGRVTLRTKLDSEKDYILIDDVVEILLRIARDGRQAIYNVAAGVNLSHGAILDVIRRETSCEVEVAPNSPTFSFAPINIDRIRDEFNYEPAPVLPSIGPLVETFRKELTRP